MLLEVQFFGEMDWSIPMMVLFTFFSYRLFPFFKSLTSVHMTLVSKTLLYIYFFLKEDPFIYMFTTHMFSLVSFLDNICFL